MDYATQKTAAAPVAQPIVVGSIGEGLVGGGAMALAIIGLAGVYPMLLLSIAVIVAGAAFLIQGTTVVSRYSRLLTEAGSQQSSAVVGGGMNAEFLGGIAGVALGILALLGVAPLALTSIAVIVFGATLIASGGTTSRMLTLFNSENERVNRILQEAANSSISFDIIAGVGAIALGILALIGIVPLALSLVGVLAIGAVIFLSGSAIGSRMAGTFSH